MKSKLTLVGRLANVIGTCMSTLPKGKIVMESFKYPYNNFFPYCVIMRRNNKRHIFFVLVVVPVNGITFLCRCYDTKKWHGFLCCLNTFITGHFKGT